MLDPRKSNEITILLFLAILAYHCIGEFANVVNSIEKSIFCKEIRFTLRKIDYVMENRFSVTKIDFP